MSPEEAAALEHDERVSCLTKVWFATHSEAKRHWKRLRKQPGRHHLQIYECRWCPNFHIGNPPGHQTYLRVGSPNLTRRPDTAAAAGRRTPAPAADDTPAFRPADYDPTAPYTTGRDTAA